MSRNKFEENCPGCRLVLLDPKTGKKLSDDDPLVRTAQAEFDKLNRLEKEAWHRVTCLNSRTPADLQLLNKLMKTLEAAYK